MAVFLSPVGGAGAQFFDGNGDPLSGGKLYTYSAGTTTPAVTYTSSAGNTAHSNPIILDAAGRVPGSSEIWLTDSIAYKFVLKDSNDVLQATWDNITGINSNFVNFTAQEEVQTATAGQTVFTLADITYTPGSNNLQVFVDGVNQIVDDSYLETNSTTVTFVSGLHVGALVKFTTAVSNSSGIETDAALVTYDPPFIGSESTTVEAKLAQYVSVKDFGAVGDGVADDTAAIQAAIDYCSVNGNSLYAPAGIYRINSGLTITNAIKGGFVLFGDGWSTVDGSFNTESGTRFYYYGSANAFTVSGTTLDNVEHVTLRGFSIENKSGSAGSTIGIRTNNTRWNTFENLYVAGFNIGIDHNNLSWFNRFIGCLVYNNATYGINNQNDGEDSLFENCFVRYNGVAGVIVNQAKNNTFITCDFGNNPKGLVLYGSGIASVPDVTCIGCIWEDNPTNCIDINTAAAAPLFPVVNLLGGRMFDSGPGGTVAINAVVWSQINITGVECNFDTFIDTSSGAGNYGPIFVQGVRFGGATLLNGDTAALRQAGTNTGTKVLVPNGSMANGWTNHAENPTYYWKDWNNVVHLGGQVQNGTIGAVVFQLPAGFRPSEISRFPTASNGAFGECYIDAGGQVYALVGNNTRFSFEGITFYAGN